VQLCSLLYTLQMTVSRYSAFLIAESVSFYHSWASASRANAASTGIPASIISVRYRSIPVPDWGTLISVPDSPAFRHFKNCTKVRKLWVAHLGFSVAHMVLCSSVGDSVAQ
jgi:hypothetical protein